MFTTRNPEEDWIEQQESKEVASTLFLHPPKTIIIIVSEAKGKFPVFPFSHKHSCAAEAKWWAFPQCYMADTSYRLYICCVNEPSYRGRIIIVIVIVIHCRSVFSCVLLKLNQLVGLIRFFSWNELKWRFENLFKDISCIFRLDLINYSKSIAFFASFDCCVTRDFPL